MADRMSLSTLITYLHKRITLTTKMVVLTVIVGLVAWAILDNVQTRRFRSIFQAQLAEKLGKQAIEDRLSFDRYVKAHHQLVKIIVAQKKFNDYIKEEQWSTEDNIQIKYYRRLPVWFPKLSLLRTFAQPRYALLLDAQGRVREVYQGRYDALPPSLLHPTPLLLAKSYRQSFMTNLDGVPYLATSESLLGSQGGLLATLMLACPIDNEFLIAALGFSVPGHIVALLTSGEDPQILTSSNLVELPAGTPLHTLQKQYFITGKEFFDYGAAEQIIKFASFISTAEVESLIKTVISRERQQRAISAPVFILTFALIMFWITRRIQQLTQRIADFSEHALGRQQQEFQKGDQLHILEERFHRLTEEVLEARDALNKEAEEKLLLEKKNMEMEQKDKQLELLQSVTEAMSVGVITNTRDGLRAANKQMGYFVKRCGGLSAFEIHHGAGSVERSLLDDRGDKRIFHISSHTLAQEEIFLVRDITEIKAQSEALEHLALHDALTNLPNRSLLQDRLQQAILVGQREHKSLALLVMDLDRFKEVNDTLGHHIGDLVLKEVGTRLPRVLRKSDTIARFGGDEFAVLLPAVDAEYAKQAACKLLYVLEQPFVVEGNSLYIGASIGIVFYPDHGEDANTLIQRADVAMYVAKQAQCGLAIYNPDQDRHSMHQLMLMSELRYAIEHEELMLYYQPRINYKSGCISGVEALVRWQHPQRGFTSPDEFISLAEHTGLIKPLTEWVLDTAMRQCADWHRAGIEISVSVNLSVRNLQDLQLPEEIVRHLKVWNVAPRWIELEITESAMMSDPMRSMEILTQLDTIGVRISIDDFGTGYSSLAYLKKLPVDEIKIDRSFVMNMVVDNNDAIIVRSTIDLAHNLGLKVLAEGVESQEVLDILERLGCDAAQGNYISPPLSAQEFTHWLSESPWGLLKKDKAR